jgi:glyceraldehyde 3-phosphate dehydrogenase
MLRIGINGFGRIGRMVTRAFFESSSSYEDIKIECINDISDKNTNIHLLKYDSIHGRFGFDVSNTGLGISINGQDIKMISEPDPEKIDFHAPKPY